LELRGLSSERLYDTSNLKYPVLYLLHGNGGNLYAMKYIFRYSARPAMLQPER
jgi:hypothetical protein